MNFSLKFIILISLVFQSSIFVSAKDFSGDFDRPIDNQNLFVEVFENLKTAEGFYKSIFRNLNALFTYLKAYEGTPANMRELNSVLIRISDHSWNVCEFLSNQLKKAPPVLTVDTDEIVIGSIQSDLDYLRICFAENVQLLLKLHDINERTPALNFKDKTLNGDWGVSPEEQKELSLNDLLRYISKLLLMSKMALDRAVGYYEAGLNNYNWQKSEAAAANDRFWNRLYWTGAIFALSVSGYAVWYYQQKSIDAVTPRALAAAFQAGVRSVTDLAGNALNTFRQIMTPRENFGDGRLGGRFLQTGGSFGKESVAPSLAAVGSLIVPLSPNPLSQSAPSVLRTNPSSSHAASSDGNKRRYLSAAAILKQAEKSQNERRPFLRGRNDPFDLSDASDIGYDPADQVDDETDETDNGLTSDGEGDRVPRDPSSGRGANNLSSGSSGGENFLQLVQRQGDEPFEFGGEASPNPLGQSDPWDWPIAEDPTSPPGPPPGVDVPALKLRKK